jgi:uncharacterized protein (DUF362 family)
MSKDSEAERRAYSRRLFLKYGTLGALGLAAARRLPAAIGGGPSSPTAAAALPTASRFASSASPAVARSKVVLVRHPAVIDASGKVQGPLLQSILDTALTTFTGDSTAAGAWRRFVSPDDVVGLKLNTLGLQEIRRTELTLHYSAIVDALAAGLRGAGVSDKNIVAWDRSEEEMSEAGLVIQKEPGRIRVIGCKAGRMDPGDYAPATYAVGSRSSRVTTILSDLCSALINVPVPKTHARSLLTCALKNHYGTIDNPFEFHADGCSNPGIAEVNAIPIIRKKQRLVVSDALLIVPEAGARWTRRFIRPFGGVIVGTDSVAVDAVALKIIDDARAAEGMDRLGDRVVHLTLAEKLGLGNSRLENIDLVSLTLS